MEINDLTDDSFFANILHLEDIKRDNELDFIVQHLEFIEEIQNKQIYSDVQNLLNSELIT